MTDAGGEILLDRRAAVIRRSESAIPDDEVVERLVVDARES
jgi:hypothetical protein